MDFNAIFPLFLHIWIPLLEMLIQNHTMQRFEKSYLMWCILSIYYSIIIYLILLRWNECSSQIKDYIYRLLIFCSKCIFLQTYTIITYAMTGATIYMIKNKLHDAVSALLTDLPSICTSKYGFSQASIRFPFEHEIFTWYI